MKLYQRFKVVFKDGYINSMDIMKVDKTICYRLGVSNKIFGTLDELLDYYKGDLKEIDLLIDNSDMYNLGV